MLARVKNLVIAWDKYKRLVSRGGKIITQEEKKQENKVWYIYETRQLGLLLIMSSEFYLWMWDGLFIANKCRYNYSLDKQKIEI